jgi:tannase/feruloyl esterase
VEEFGIVTGTDNPGLSAFRDRRGKAIIWHGWVDPLITAEGTTDYYTRVRQQMGAEKTSQFARLFPAPGIGHCGSGAIRVDYAVATVVPVSAGSEIQKERGAQTTPQTSSAAPGIRAVGRLRIALAELWMPPSR